MRVAALGEGEKRIVVPRLLWVSKAAPRERHPNLTSRHSLGGLRVVLDLPAD